MWVNIPNFGVIKAELDENLYPQNREIFLSEQFTGQGHMLVQDNSGVKVITEQHEYRYNENQKSFTEIKRNSVENGISDLILRNSEPVLLNDDYEFYPVYNGFALKLLDKPDQPDDTGLELIIRQLEAYSNDEQLEIFDGAEVAHYLNNLRIVASVPNRNNVMYQYRASDSDEWSDLTRNNTLELVGLGYGEHKYFVRASVGDKITPATAFSFIISAPWYLSWPALLFYFFAVTFVFYMMYVWQGMSLSKQKKYLLMNQRNSLREQKERYRRQLQQVEEGKLRAEYDKVKAQLKSKTIELATKAKENDEKQKILQTLNEKIEKLKQNPDSVMRQSDEIQRIIDTHIDSEDNTFEIQIDELHQEFFDVLRNEYPDLTRYDLRLCVYIKMGFDSKEISDLLNIKPSSVYISRSRLRKKIGLDSEEDLHAFLNSVVESET
jgi:DNA-binding CsgD family transcriptional regulator